MVVEIVVIAMVVVVDAVVVAGCRGCGCRGSVGISNVRNAPVSPQKSVFFPTCRHGLLLFWRVRLYSVRVV